jgi:hypothetical protein
MLAAEHGQANLLLRVYDQQNLSAAVLKSKIRQQVIAVRYHSGGPMKLNACILLLTHMVYL